MLYGSIAEIYDRYRPSYGSAPFDLLRSELKTFDRVVDLGAGTGHVTRSLLTLFSSVTAVEPDSRMARRLPSCDGLTVIEAFAENVDFPNSSLDAVVSGTALHWMDVHRVCASVDRWLKSDGVFFFFGFPAKRGALHIAPEGARAFLKREHEKWKPYKQPSVSDWVPYIELVEGAGIPALLRPWQCIVELTWSPRDLAGYFLSTSFASAYADFNGGTHVYLAKLEENIIQAVGLEKIRVTFTVEGVIGRRN